MLALLTLALLAGAGAPPDPPDPIVAYVGGAPVRASDVRRHLSPDGSRAVALSKALTTTALALEARATLGSVARGLAPADAAAALEARLFDPATRCSRLPRAQLVQRYAETRWRFVAPPAWEVDDLQLLCCTSPDACEAPHLARCRADDRPVATALREAIGDPPSRPAFIAAFDAAAGEHTRLAHKRYIFYFDPDRPDGPVHERLQQVDRPIAEAVAGLRPGEVSQVVASRFGHHLLRLERVRPAVALPFDDPRTRALLQTELCAGHLASQRARYLRDLLSVLPVSVEREALERALPVRPRVAPPTPTGPRGRGAGPSGR